MAVVAYVQQLYAALGILPGLYVESRKLGVLLQRLVDYIESEPEKSGTLRPRLRQRADVALEDVWLSYGNRRALRGVSLAVPQGQTVALVGQSGSGKSSIAMLALGLYKPDRGRVTIGGVELEKCDLGWIRRHIGLIAQEPFLFSGTIRENIAYARPQATFADIVRAARLACIDEFIQRLPDGYDTVCGERGVQLSGGQRQRITIARTVLQDPALLILDEATSALDMETEAELAAVLGKLLRERTALIISHRPSAIASADYVYVLSEGAVVEHGSLAALRATGHEFRKLLHAEPAPAVATGPLP